MLISQKLIKNPKLPTAVPGSVISSVAMRRLMIESTKLLVPRDLMDLKDPISLLAKVYGDQAISEEHPKVKAREQLYFQFCRMPWPKIWMENETGAYYVEDRGDHWFIWNVTDKAVIFPYGVAVNLKNNRVNYVGLAATPYENFHPDERTASILDQSMGLMLLEVLLFLNTSNVTIHHYTPSRRENSVIPKVLQPKFTYRILDIYRERKSYVSLADVEEFLRPHPDKQERRAHLVRGHFKRTKTGLFWWNGFLRNAKNSRTLGEVDKDYRLHAAS